MVTLEALTRRFDSYERTRKSRVVANCAKAYFGQATRYCKDYHLAARLGLEESGLLQGYFKLCLAETLLARVTFRVENIGTNEPMAYPTLDKLQSAREMTIAPLRREAGMILDRAGDQGVFFVAAYDLSAMLIEAALTEKKITEEQLVAWANRWRNEDSGANLGS